jgi:hypothetical protein
MYTVLCPSVNTYPEFFVFWNALRHRRGSDHAEGSEIYTRRRA